MPIGSQEFDYHLDDRFFIDMESSDIHGAGLDVHLTVVNRGMMYDMTFAIKGTVTLMCDRCLDDLVFDIDTTYRLTVKYGDRYDDSTDDLLEIPESDNYLNVAYLIYDTVELEVPLKHVHAPGKCNQAMKSTLGKHRARIADEDGDDQEPIDEIEQLQDDISRASIDPRWSELAKLRDINDNENN